MTYALRDSYHNCNQDCLDRYIQECVGILGRECLPPAPETLLGRYYQKALEMALLVALVMALQNAYLIGSWGMVQKGGE
jgi:hypothetical protein